MMVKKEKKLDEIMKIWKVEFFWRYQREEAKIQAWVNLENAKAEAQSRKLEVCMCIRIFCWDIRILLRSNGIVEPRANIRV